MRILTLLVWAVFCLPTNASAQSPTGLWYTNVNNGRTTAGTANPFPVTCISGCSGSGGGDATAANQVLQITQETAINTVLGTTADAAATAGSTGTESAKLRLMTTQLGTVNTNLGAPGATVCATDTGSCSLNALFQRLLQGTTSLITAVGSSVPTGGNTIGAVFGAPNVTPTDCSGTITSGGTAQNAFTAGATKHGFTVMNLSTEDMWISFTTTAAAATVASYMLNPSATGVAGGSYSTPFGFGMNTALSVIGATTGNKFSCTWW